MVQRILRSRVLPRRSPLAKGYAVFRPLGVAFLREAAHTLNRIYFLEHTGLAPQVD